MTARLAILLSGLALSLQAGEVRGIVLGPTNQPIPNARVYAFLISSPGRGLIPEVLANAKGEFMLPDVLEGTNEIHAYAPELGFGNNLASALQTAPVPTIKMRRAQRIDGVIVKLGPKPGTFSGSVVNSRTRRPLTFASIGFSWVSRPEYRVSSSVKADGSFSFQVPVQSIRILATADGYKPYQSEPVLIPSGETYHLSIELKRTDEAPINR